MEIKEEINIKYKCDCCKSEIVRVCEVLSFEGSLSAKKRVDYSLCWKCSKKLRTAYLKLKK